jgi:hypothetical protein
MFVLLVVVTFYASTKPGVACSVYVCLCGGFHCSPNVWVLVYALSPKRLLVWHITRLLLLQSKLAYEIKEVRNGVVRSLNVDNHPGSRQLDRFR